jgi:hypothetical protein
MNTAAECTYAGLVGEYLSTNLEENWVRHEAIRDLYTPTDKKDYKDARWACWAKIKQKVS